MLEVKNLDFSAGQDGQERQIIRNISLTVADGQLVVITGPNGGGKSTLAKLVAGIEKPTGGRILLNGQDITDMTVTERAKLGIGFAFQQPVKFKGISVFDLIRLATGTSVTLSRACDYLSFVGLCAKDYINREIDSSLSGGELKRIEIATVLAKPSSLFLFDEPEAGIDLWSFQNLIEVFSSLRREIHNSAIVIISHQERILNIADEIVVLRDGQLTARGSRDTIMPQLADITPVANPCTKGLWGGTVR